MTCEGIRTNSLVLHDLGPAFGVALALEYPNTRPYGIWIAAADVFAVNGGRALVVCGHLHRCGLACDAAPRARRGWRLAGLARIASKFRLQRDIAKQNMKSTERQCAFRLALWHSLKAGANYFCKISLPRSGRHAVLLQTV